MMPSPTRARLAAGRDHAGGHRDGEARDRADGLEDQGDDNHLATRATACEHRLQCEQHRHAGELQLGDARILTRPEDQLAGREHRRKRNHQPETYPRALEEQRTMQARVVGERAVELCGRPLTHGNHLFQKQVSFAKDACVAGPWSQRQTRFR